MTELGLLSPDREPALEVHALWALLDGLTLHLVVEPPGITRQDARSVLADHLKRVTSDG